MAEVEAPVVTENAGEAVPTADGGAIQEAAPTVTEDAPSNKRKLDEAGGAEDGDEERQFKRTVLEPASEAGAGTSAEVIAL